MKKPYKLASCQPAPSGFAILLDGKPARTPMGKPLILPNSALAGAVAEEWQSQGETIRKETMPLTQAACVALDLVAESRQAVLDDILPYADTDLICYRAGDIPVLLAQQAQELDPVVAWAGERFGVTLHVTQDLMPVAQPGGNKAAIAAALAEYDDWKLAALSLMVKPLGSLVLALACAEGKIDAATTFRLSHLEEAYETEKWGADAEKDMRLQTLRSDMLAMGRFLSLLLSSAN